jgi:hypothetical protein
MKKLILALLLSSALLFADGDINSPAEQKEAYKIPFSSSGNEIELTVANTSSVNLDSIAVKLNNAPQWIKFNSNEVIVYNLKGNDEKKALFSFSVDKTAPVGAETSLNFHIISNNGQEWTKEIKIKIAAPDRFELFRNYPNPFNPVTVISYQLPVVSKVELKIYNMLGQEVATLVNAAQGPGYYPVSWNASSQASGMYIYLIDAQGDDGQRHVERKKMMMVK